MVPEAQQHQMQSATVVLGSFGDLAVNGFLQTFEEPITKIRPIFFFAAIFYTATVSSLLVLGREVAVPANDPTIMESKPTSMNILGYLRSLPSWMWRIGGVYGFGFFMFFCVLPNASTWIGSAVLGGTFSLYSFSDLCRFCELNVTRQYANYLT